MFTFAIQTVVVAAAKFVVVETFHNSNIVLTFWRKLVETEERKARRKKNQPDWRT